MPLAVVVAAAPAETPLQTELLRAAIAWGETLGAVTVADDAAGAAREVGTPVVVVGTEMPTLGPFHAEAVRADLHAGVDAVFGPAHDGGWYLIALGAPHYELLATDELGSVLARAAELQLEVGLLRGERRLRTPADAEALRLHHAVPPAVAALL
jgi:hypothetical protein